MVQWIQELGTSQFQVIHHPGKKHDGLSRLPCKQNGQKEVEDEAEPTGVVATISWN